MNNDARTRLARRRAVAGMTALARSERQPTPSDWLPGEDAGAEDWLTYAIARRDLPPDSYEPSDDELRPMLRNGLPAEAARILLWRTHVMIDDPAVGRAYRRTHA